LSEKAPLGDKQELTLQRIERAGLTMSDLTDTLLWLSREEEQTTTPESINLHEKIKQLCNELSYLLNAKEVEVKISGDTCNHPITATACHIVLSNLIRNAYQHTQQGQVTITQQGSRITIINSTSDSSSRTLAEVETDTKQTALGYGLGLQLSEKIINRQGWLYQVKECQGHYHVTVDFDNSARNHSPMA
jgi:signal transduction histidine kinase